MMIKTQQPTITTFIPTYKRPQLLKRAIQSLLDQTYADFRVCVLDNASGDETSAVVSELAAGDARIQYVCHPKNIGMIANYQYAFKHVETPYFSILSDDDFLLPCFYETVLGGFLKYPDIGFSAASSVIMTPSGSVRAAPLEYWPKEGLYQVPEGVCGGIGKSPVPNTVLFNRKVIDVVGELDVENILVWDCDFLMRVAALFPIVISKKPCGIFLEHKNSCSYTANANLWCDGFSRLFERFMNDCSIPQDVKSAVKPIFINFLRDQAYDCGKDTIVKKRYAEVAEVVLILSQRYGMHREAKRLRLASRICQMIPPCHSLLVALRNYRRREVTQQLQRQYGYLSHHLQEYES